MIDEPLVLKDYLRSKSTLTMITGDRLWPQRNNPPKGYKPSHGGGIAFMTRGGTLAADDCLANTSWRFKCYGKDEQDAWQVYRALVSVLHDAQEGDLMASGLDVLGQPFNEPSTGWDYVLCFFSTIMKSRLEAA